MSISCVRRSVLTVISRTGAYPTEPCPPSTLTSRELDAFRDDADRFIAELDEEYYLHYAGPQGDARARADLRAPRGADEARDGAAARGRADRALALRVRGLPRQPDARAPGAAREGRGRARGDRRRRDDPVPDAARRARERARPRPARSGSRQTRLRLHRRAPEPGLPRGGADRPRGRRSSSARRTTTSSTSASASASTSSPRSARSCSTRPSGCGRRRATGSSASGSASALADARPWDVRAPLPRARVGHGVSGRPDAAGARGDAARPRHRPARAGERPPRPRAAAGEEPARVLRADRGARAA